jgi:Heparinase II/III-like protein.
VSTRVCPNGNNQLIPYENFTNLPHHRDILLAKAEETIINGWQQSNYPFIPLTVPFQWLPKEASKYRSLAYHIQQFDMLEYLLIAYDLSNDVKYLNIAAPIVLEWIDLYGCEDMPGIPPFAWYDMAVGLRAHRMAYFFDAACRKDILDDNQQILLWNSLLRHQDYLAKEENIKFHNNHGFYQIAGQLALGRRFMSHAPSMMQTYEQGQERFRDILAKQFTMDGIHKEHSPDYHRMVYDALHAILKSGLITEPETIQFANTIECALSWFVTAPEPHFANFGDSDLREIPLIRFGKKTTKWATPEMNYLLSKGQLGKSSDKQLAIFQEGGYVVYRKLEDDKFLDRASSLTQLACFHSRTHKHADDLTFIWSDRGSAILVDAGRYGYVGKTEMHSDLWQKGYWYSDPSRMYCESTRAHNTLEFDETDYPRKGVKPYGSAVRRWVDDQENSGVVAWETECKHFTSIVRARLLIFNPGQWLVIVDWFNDNLKNPHTVKQWFHLDPDLTAVHQEDQQFRIESDSFGTSLQVASLLAQPQASRLYRGEKEPQMQGWVSRKPLEMLPSFAFNYELESVSTGVFATLFVFSKSLSVSADHSSINISGRKGRLRWADDRGRHSISFERPKSGEMTIGYMLK